MRFIDQALWFIGENPAAYAEKDKWIALQVYLFDTAPLVLPWILGALPLLWLAWRKYKSKPITQKHVMWTVVLVVILALLGYFGPGLLFGILAWASFGGGFYINL